MLSCLPTWVARRRHSLRNWLKQAEIDAGGRPGRSTADAQRMTELQRERIGSCAGRTTFSRPPEWFFATELDGRPSASRARRPLVNALVRDVEP
jgi:transposase